MPFLVVDAGTMLQQQTGHLADLMMRCLGEELAKYGDGMHA